MASGETTHANAATRQRLAVFKFASCDGCQLQLLSCEDELLAIADRIDIVHFLEATSHVEPGPYDVALVEGSITTAEDRARIQAVRRDSRYLVTIGACATSGGIQSLKNWGDRGDFIRCVYPHQEFISTLATSTAIADHVTVDFELRGCPINRHQLLEVIRALVNHQRPKTPAHSVCLDCKRNGNVCVAVARDVPCLGPVTQSGCGAICPAYDRGCYGCHGPLPQTNCASLSDHYLAGGTTPQQLVPLLRNFNANAPAFREEGDRVDPHTDLGKRAVSEKRTRKIEVGALSRVEGEGGLRVVVEDDHVTEVQLSIYEPPRFFESLLRGRPLAETPDITSRICGICPVAYQMTSVHALERALEITISPEVRVLRRLMYCAEWIESHGVHVHLLHIPDFFGCDSSIELARQCPSEVKRGLRLKKHGNELLEVLGGRAVNPINVSVGGFYRVPKASELKALLDDLSWGRDAAIAVVRWVAEFDFPDFDRDCEMIALQNDQEYPLNEGRVASTQGWSTDVDQFEQRFGERQVPHSTALHSVHLPAESPYCVGALARVNLNRDLLSPSARELSSEVGIQWPCLNPYQSIVARSLEVVHAYEESIEIIRQYQPPSPPRAAYEAHACEGFAATEAPRGLIYNRFRVDESGLIESAKIVPPTSQNQRQIETDLEIILPSLLSHDDTEVGLACERLIRSYDPCISCSTHFLKLEIERR